MAENRTKRKRDEDLPRVTYNAGPRTFDRLLKEESLEEMKYVVRKKLGYASDVRLQLAQLRDGKPVDLEDDDDFEAFCSAAHTLPHIVVQVTLSSEPHLEGTGTPCQPSPSAQNPRIPETPKRRKKKRRLELAEGGAEEIADPSNKRKAPSNEERDSQASGVPAPKEQDEGRPKKKTKKDIAKDAVESTEQPVAALKEVSVQPQSTNGNAALTKPEDSKKKRRKKKGVVATDEAPPKDLDTVEPVVVQTKKTLAIVEEPTPDGADIEIAAEKSKKRKRPTEKPTGKVTLQAPAPDLVSEEAARVQQEEEPVHAKTPPPASTSISRPEEEAAPSNGKVEKKKKNKKDVAADLAEAITRAAELNEKQGPPQDSEITKAAHPAEKDKDVEPARKVKSKQNKSKQSKDASVNPQDREALDAVFAAVLNRKKPSVDQQPPAEDTSVSTYKAAASESKAEKPKPKKPSAQCPICLAVAVEGRAHTKSRCPLIRSAQIRGLCDRLNALEKETSADEDGSRAELIKEIKGYIIKKGSERALKKAQPKGAAVVPAPPSAPANSKKTSTTVEKTFADGERETSATSYDSLPVPPIRSARPPPPAQESISAALSSAQIQGSAHTLGKAKALEKKAAARNDRSSSSISLATTANLDDQLDALVRGPSAIRVNQIPSSSSEESEDEQLLEEEEEEEEKPTRARRFSAARRGGDSSDEEQSENSDEDDSCRAVTAPPVISTSTAVKPAKPHTGGDRENGESADNKAGERSFQEVNDDSCSLDIQPVGDRAVSEALAQDTQVFRLSAAKFSNPSQSEDSEDDGRPKRNAAFTPQDSEDERNADPDAGEDSDEDVPAPNVADHTPQDSEDERNADPDAGEDSEDERNADPDAGEEEDGAPSPDAVKATLEDSEDERNADPDADKPAEEGTSVQTTIAKEPRPTTPKRPTHRVRQESIEQFDTPNGPNSPVAVFGKSAVHSTPRIVDKMKDRSGKTPQPSPSRPLSSMDKAMKLLESVKHAKLPTTSQKPAAAPPKTPAARTRASARLASQPPPDKVEVAKPPSQATRGRKAVAQVSTVAEEEPERPKPSARAMRGRRATASQPTETLEHTPAPKRMKQRTKQPEEQTVVEDERESRDGHEETEEAMQPMSMDNWEILEEEHSVAPDQTMMVDELESDGLDGTHIGSPKPLFLESETPHGFPYSQWADAANPRQAASDSDNDEEEEVARAMMRRPKAPQRASQSFRRLTDIASQDIPQFHSAVRPARPSNDKPKTSERDLFGRSDDSESSDSGSSDSDNDKKKRSHIPQARRAGKAKA